MAFSVERPSEFTRNSGIKLGVVMEEQESSCLKQYMEMKCLFPPFLPTPNISA